jgi:hypothetical protein
LAVLWIGAPSADAQTVDARWTPFIGCWELNDGGASTCVAPAAPAAATLSTRVEGKQVLEQTIIPDGAAHSVTEEACTGSQRAEWSRDGRKLFTRADLTCANQPLRTVTGFALMTGENSWIDVQAVDIGGGTSVRVRRYRRAQGERPRLDASIAPYGGARLTIDDVKEAHAKVAPAVLEAVVAETGARFALNARELVGLDEAGVPGNVIDLMVANSFPEKFQVERRAAASIDAYPPTYGSGWWSGYWGLGYPYFYSYPGYYVDYRDYYSPYGYSYGYPGSYYYYPGPGAGGDEESPDGGGRVVNGVGYTRVRTRDAATTRSDDGSGSSSGSSTSRPASSGRGTMTSSGATQSSGGSSSSGGGSSSSGSGSSGNSGGSDTGRTAQPR